MGALSAQKLWCIHLNQNNVKIFRPTFSTPEVAPGWQYSVFYVEMEMPCYWVRKIQWCALKEIEHKFKLGYMGSSLLFGSLVFAQLFYTRDEQCGDSRPGERNALLRPTMHFQHMCRIVVDNVRTAQTLKDWLVAKELTTDTLKDLHDNYLRKRGLSSWTVAHCLDRF